MRKILFGVLFLLAAGAAQARVLEGRIIGCSTAMRCCPTDVARIRLLGIDARVRPAAAIAREHAAPYARQGGPRRMGRMDDYGRIVGVLLISGCSVAAETTACADPATSMLRTRTNRSARSVRRIARAGREGGALTKIGRASGPIPPWEWRTRQRLGILDEVPGRTSVSHSR
jgi:hypothetical protein